MQVVVAASKANPDPAMHAEHWFMVGPVHWVQAELQAAHSLVGLVLT